LGPEWKRTFEGATTVIGNQTSFMDLLIVGINWFPTMVADRISTQIFPGANKIADILDSIWVDRFGSKESKKETLNKMINH